ncbi:hypothetical protein D9M71_103430 [compost metagenome]
MAQEALVIAIEQRAGGDHLGVKQGTAGEQAQEVAAVAVGPVHHGRNAEAAGGFWARGWGVVQGHQGRLH